MKPLRQFSFGVFLLLVLSIPAVAGEISCPSHIRMPGDMGQPRTQASSSVTEPQDSSGVDGHMGNPCATRDIGNPCEAGEMGYPRVGEIGFPVMSLIIAILF